MGKDAERYKKMQKDRKRYEKIPKDANFAKMYLDFADSAVEWRYPPQIPLFCLAFTFPGVREAWLK